ncbi:uncharacterized protein LOC127736050 isoform X2 [Mytilus californianus]|nr:uncharacterized protein LOC127736050 isoform X2 [Mytilus californianus]XP_052102509.1 uncharacterized protein LOC127736050 isoform X2 [Mytilus californianus]
MAATEPDEITIIVVAGKGLQGKKQGRHKFSVIFGVGNRKYRTCVVKDADGCPEWNEESVIQVNNVADQVFLIVTEKEDILGQINIPVTTLLGPPGRVMKNPLQSHKKCPSPKGELIYQCFVSKYRPSFFPNSSTPKHTSIPNVYDKHRNGMTSSPIMRHKHEKRRGSTALQTLNKKFSKSIHDLFSFARSPTQDNDDKNVSNLSNGRSSSIGSGMNNAGKLPIIHSVTPSDALIDGGTRVTIEGKNLGLSKADIMELLICEVDHADYVEFESSSRIFLKIKPSTAGIGDIILETESGGIGTLKNGFTYVDPNAPSSPSVTGDESDTSSSNTRFSIGDEELSNNVITPASPKVPKSPKVKMCVTLPDVDRNNDSDGKSKKHFLKHIRRASEGHVLFQSKGPVQAVVPQVNIESLQAEIARLKKDNKQIDVLKDEIESLKNDKKDMKVYIDKLVAKVITHCPEALATDDDMEFKSKFG